MFPPGQAATRIIPKAMVGVGFNSRTSKKVNAGNKNAWLMKPTIADLGFRKISSKFSILMSRATPNMIKEKRNIEKNQSGGREIQADMVKNFERISHKSLMFRKVRDLKSKKTMDDPKAVAHSFFLKSE